MPAGVFQARCLAVMDEVQAKCETVIITKHGKPVAKLVPVDAEHDFRLYERQDRHYWGCRKTTAFLQVSGASEMKTIWQLHTTTTISKPN